MDDAGLTRLVEGRTYRLAVQDCCIEGVEFTGVLAEIEREGEEPVGFVFRNGPCVLRLSGWQVPDNLSEIPLTSTNGIP